MSRGKYGSSRRGHNHAGRRRPPSIIFAPACVEHRTSRLMACKHGNSDHLRVPADKQSYCQHNKRVYGVFCFSGVRYGTLCYSTPASAHCSPAILEHRAENIWPGMVKRNWIRDIEKGMTLAWVYVEVKNISGNMTWTFRHVESFLSPVKNWSWK